MAESDYRNGADAEARRYFGHMYAWVHATLDCFYAVDGGYHRFGHECAPYSDGVYVHHRCVLAHAFPAAEWDERALQIAAERIARRRGLRAASLRALDGAHFLLTYCE